MIPSRLTRRVFRRLRSNQPLVSHRQLHRTAPRLLRPRHAQITLAVVPARTFIGGLFKKQEGDIRKPLLDPGMDKMLELDRRIHLVARLPPQKDLVQAFNAFIDTKIKRKRAIQDFQALQLLQTLEILEKRHVPDGSPSLDNAALRAGLQAISQVPPDSGYTEAHNKLARALFQAIRDRAEDKPKIQIQDETKLEPQEEPKMDSQERFGVPMALITILCATGEPREARHLLEQLGEPPPNQRGPRAASWALVLAGFSKLNEEKALEKTIEKMQELNIEFSTNVARTLAVHFARHDNVEEAKKWYGMVDLKKPRSPHSGNSFTQDETVYQALLEFCLRNGEMEWGRHILTPDGLVKHSFNRWDAMFRASAATGRSVDEIDRMVSVMARRADESGQEELRPDVDTFNGLIRFAISKGDAYLAERYFGLMEKWSVKPTAETYCLQIDYRLAAGDLDGALASYNLLREQEIVEDEDWATMNKLLQVLTTKPSAQSDTLMGVRDDILDRRRPIPAATTLALCKWFLLRDDYPEVVALLNSLSFNYSTSQRIEIRDMMVNFTLNPETDTGRAWESYMIFHQVFDRETRCDVRNRAMTFFFARGRPDLATYIFTNMSKHVRADTRPSLDTYIRAFEGIAATGDPDALEVIHNLMKLDTDIEPCTHLYNCLMIAYAACDMPLRAVEFWREISTSDEGPTYNSLKIALRACERLPFGYNTARQIWGKLRQADIEIDRQLFTSYVACCARQRMFEDMYAEMKGMKELTGEEPDVNTLVSLFHLHTHTHDPPPPFPLLSLLPFLFSHI